MSGKRRKDGRARETREPIFREDQWSQEEAGAEYDEYEVGQYEVEDAVDGAELGEHWEAFGDSGSDARQVSDERPPRRRRTGLFLTMLILFLVVVIGVVVGAGYAISKVFGGSSDYSGPGTTAVTIQVQSGDTATDIADTLKAADVVKSTGAFTAAAAADDRSRSIQPGYYKLREQMKASLALAALLDHANLLATKVAIPEGFTAAQIVARIAAHTPIPLADLKAALANPLALGLPAYADGHAEGFLFPATYDIDPGRTAVEALTQLTAAFQNAAASIDLVDGARLVGLTPLQVVTAASLVQAEVKPGDFAKVAEVIFNRLHDKHPLGLETAERYGAGISGSQPLGPVIAKAEASPYDTYLHAGLPIGPIDNPGEAALQAILHPATGSLYFYLTDPKTNVTTFFNRNDYAGFNAASIRCKDEGGCR